MTPATLHLKGKILSLLSKNFGVFLHSFFFCCFFTVLIPFSPLSSFSVLVYLRLHSNLQNDQRRSQPPSNESFYESYRLQRSWWNSIVCFCPLLKNSSKASSGDSDGPAQSRVQDLFIWNLSEQTPSIQGPMDLSVHTHVHYKNFFFLIIGLIFCYYSPSSSSQHMSHCANTYLRMSYFPVRWLDTRHAHMLTFLLTLDSVTLCVCPVVSRAEALSEAIV